MFDDIADSDYQPGMETLPPDKHLDSPVTVGLLSRIISLSKRVGYKDKRTAGISILPFSEGALEQDIKRNPNLYFSGFKYVARCFIETMKNEVITLSISEASTYPKLWERESRDISYIREDVTLASLLYNLEMRSYANWTNKILKGGEIDNFRKAESNFNVSPETFLLYKKYRYWDKLVDAYRVRKKDKKYGKKYQLKFQDKTFCFFDGFVAEWDTPLMGKSAKTSQLRNITLYAYEQLMMFQDAMLSRLNVFLALDLNFHNGDDNLRLHVSQILAWQELCLTTYGNKGYDLVKGPESVFKTWLTKLSDGDILKYTSYNRTIEKLAEKERILLGSKSLLDETPLVSHLDNLVRNVVSINNSVECFGLTKLSGHPTVDAVVSALSVQSEAKELGSICPVAVTQYPLFLKRIILFSYLEKNGDWPPFKIKPREGTSLFNFWAKRRLDIKPNDFPISDLLDVRFSKWMEFDYSPDYLEFMDDKAISPGASEASKFWYGGNVSSSRRLLEKLLKVEEVDTKAIVKRMSEGRFFPDERIVELTQKEREFKIAARCFAKLVFEVRLFFVLTEANLKNFMGGPTGRDGYIPQQTMTMSESAVKRRLYDLAKTTPGSNAMCLEVDFSRWNLKWRNTTVNPCARIVEDIFGFPGVFSQVHDFFYSSTILLTDKHVLPSTSLRGRSVSLWPESELVWRGHRGGFEGIQQSLWTICTIAMMHWALDGLNVSFLMAGQGDNQIFSLAFPPNIDKEKNLMKLLVQVETRCARLNHEIKPDECIDSSSVITYSKEIYVSGVHRLYTLKFASRSFVRQDLGVPSLLKEISSANANAMACAASCYKSYKAIMWKFLMTIFVLRGRSLSPIYKDEMNLLNSMLDKRTCQLLLIPGSLGGLPMLPWSRFLIRGESDPLAWDVSASLATSHHVPRLRHYLRRLLDREFLQSPVDATRLLSDPHSIPVTRPDDESRVISRVVENVIPQITRNKNIRQIISPCTKVAGKDYSEMLISTRPLVPEILSDLLQISPAGMRDRMLGRFTMTRTVGKLAGNLNFSKEIKNNTVKLLALTINRWRSCRDVHCILPTSPFQFSSLLRDQWGVNLDNAAVGTYTPLDFQLDISSSRNSMVTAHLNTKIENLLTQLGPAPPNFGTNTKAKVSQHGFILANTGSTISDLKRAVLIASELGSTSSVISMINSVVEARCPWSTETLLSIFPTVYGGTGVHRHRSLSKKSYGVLGSSTVPTHLTYGTDSAGILSGGEDDYPVVFQEMFLTLNHLAQVASAGGSSCPLSFGFVIPETLVGIPDLTITSSQVFKPIPWTDMKSNSLAYVKILTFFDIPRTPSHPSIVQEQCKSRGLTQMDRVLLYLNGRRELKSILSLPPETEVLTSDLIDLKEFSRLDPNKLESCFMIFAFQKSLERICLATRDLKNEHDMALEVFSILKRFLFYLSSCFCRSLLHPKTKHGDYAVENSIRLYPGKFGYLKSAKDMANKWFWQINNQIKKTEMSLSSPNLCIDFSWENFISHSLPGFTAAYLLLFSLTPLSLLQAVKVSRNLTFLANVEGSDKSAVIGNLPERLGRMAAFLKFEVIIPKRVKYVNVSPEEILRPLRDDERDKAHSKFLLARSADSVLLKRPGEVKWKFQGVSGLLGVSLDTVFASNEERIQSHKRRKIGSTASVYSDWVAARQSLKIQTSGLRCGIFGVGRGALARLILNSGANAIGYDLRSSVPMLPHRLSSYVPPEISNDPKGFDWSRCFDSTSGDVFTEELYFNQEGIDLAFIDLDLGIEQSLILVNRLPAGTPCITRVRATLPQLQWLIDALRPSKICQFSHVSDSVSSYFVFVHTSKVEKYEGNLNNVQLTKYSPLEYKTYSTEQCQQLEDVLPSLFSKYPLDNSSPRNCIRSLKRHLNKNIPSEILLLRMIEEPDSYWTKTRVEKLSFKYAKILGKIKGLIESSSKEDSKSQA